MTRFLHVLVRKDTLVLHLFLTFLTLNTKGTYRAVAKTLIRGGGGINIYVFCPTNYFGMNLKNN